MDKQPDALQELLDRPAAEKERLGYLQTAVEMMRQPDLWRQTADLVCRAFPALAAFRGTTGRAL
ncbi:MAG TPA: hypothetical protein VMQ10_00615, partial [Spirochaetia bacterium]|nr:hypothetical protein [Spirochaetia bacterium]